MVWYEEGLVSRQWSMYLGVVFLSTRHGRCGLCEGRKEGRKEGGSIVVRDLYVI